MKSIAQIAAELQGYDPQSLTTERASAFLSELMVPVCETENISLFDALGRVLAKDIISPVSVPPHDNSAMDGFAFKGAQLQPGLPLQLKVVGTAFAGRAWQGEVGDGECVKIMTGAVMPEGLDTVAPLELALIQGDAVHIPVNALKSGDNRRHIGEDLMAGHTALAQGKRLGPAALGLVASLGLSQVQVYRRVRVAYFSTGDEILSAGEAPRVGAVYDSNRYTVIGMLKQLGCEVIDLGVIRDDPALLENALRQAAARADAIITSGGVSAGEADHTRALMQKLGDMAFWRVAMRPGRPMAVGRISASSGDAQCKEGLSVPTPSAVLFGLPGNPVAVMVTFIAFVRPALLRMMGASAKPQVMLRAISENPIRKKPGRTEYQRCIVTPSGDGQPTVRITGNQGSGVLSSMVQANGLLVLEHDQGNVAAGDEVNVLMLNDL